jgi:hypothetical protein
MIVDLVAIVPIMTSLWIFLAVCPIALGSLLVFASHIDPLSGRWRSGQRTGRVRPPAAALRARATQAMRTSGLRDALRSRASVIACSESPSTGS